MTAQPSVLDRLRNAALAARKAKGPRCRVCSLPPAVLEAVHALRMKDGMTYTELVAALGAEGHEVAGERVNTQNLSHHFTERHHEQREG